MPKPLVSIVSINYNQAQVTCEMVFSLRKITYPNIEIIVVDNASPSEAPDLIEEQCPEVKLIRSSVNLGYAGGNNLGVMQAKGEYILFLNNDTEVEPGFLEPLVDLFEHNAKAGVASPKIIYHNTDSMIQYAGSHGINAWTGRSITIGQFEKDKGQHNVSRATALADGAAMMVPMRVIQQVGLMPELYFLYYEELDWCEIMKRAGYSCHYVADSTIYHKESVSVGKFSVLKTYYMNRNRLLFIRRNMSGWKRWSSALVFLLAALPKKVLTHGARQEWKHLKALQQGLWWHLANNAACEPKKLKPTQPSVSEELALNQL
ncbi:glycosyltransferase family 2 protein [Pontibacter sp. SGAir0037]|uniref:glycosyltransferase family 2 protein n=1 Tax=Pontibacter sp. SGAir0037 TaxID=2571030 RepID=UPI0010CCF906|nr:glycosyltransferase family 2 protein [Pontibacter sp. SGAir0037]QCR22502.1 dTDP-Rha--alpha-D-GlcNAc-pyrophosphate polyprenol alpha-3-L-rhamnosyltransferase [Pontibacter sp. SGAir0037]